MSVFQYTIQKPTLTNWISIEPPTSASIQPKVPAQSQKSPFISLQPLRQWLDGIAVRDRNFAHSLCKLIPAQCPFERDIKLFGKVLFHIPPMCKLNPLYEEVVGLRFRALCYLADECGEDITVYC